MLLHIREVHSQDVNIYFQCVYPYCTKAFCKFSSFESHVSRCQSLTPEESCQAKRLLEYKFKCDQNNCTDLFVNIEQLKKHYKAHIKSTPKKYQCIYHLIPTDKDCTFESEKLTHYGNHMSRNHRSASHQIIRKNLR